MSYLSKHGTRRVPQWLPLAGQVANSKREVANCSELSLRNFSSDLNSAPGFASLMIGSTISPAPPVVSSWPTLRTSPYSL